uniref:(northern house mosquito) hypothetical protein n=1 Tax=Culex pipiens TaxID=7175 RepID=A0A8D8DZ35_CULPI
MAHRNGSVPAVDDPVGAQLADPVLQHGPDQDERTPPQAGHSEPPNVVVLLLPDLPLVPEPDGRSVALCRPQVLQRLVERQQHRHLLAQLEHARAQLVRPTPLPSDARPWLPEAGGHRYGLLFQCLLPRVPRVGPAQDLQDLGLYGHDGADSALVRVQVYGTELWSTARQHRRVGLDHPGATAGDHDVLPRLHDYALQRRAAA